MQQPRPWPASPTWTPSSDACMRAPCCARSSGPSHHDRDLAHGEWPRRLGRGRAADPSRRFPPRPAAPHRHASRVRAWDLRRLHGADRRRARALLHHLRGRLRRARGPHHRGLRGRRPHDGAARGLLSGARPAMRILHRGHADLLARHRAAAAGCRRAADPDGAFRQSLPLHRLCRDREGGDERGGTANGARGTLTLPAPALGPSLSRSTGEGRKSPSPALEREREGPVAQRREGEGAREGWTRIDESFVIAAPPGTVWRALADFPRVAACLPGAELTEHDARSVKGRLRVKLGPMAASFAGSATVQRDDAGMTGIAKGAGTDSNSRSRTRGELAYRLTPESGGRQTQVAVSVQYDLQGPLAQFSRSNLARDFASRVVAEFASNLNRALAGGEAQAAEAPRPLNALELIWSVIWNRLKGLFGRR